MSLPVTAHTGVRNPLPSWLPLLVAALAYASFVCMDVTIKSLAARHGAVQLAFLRFASGSAFALGLWLWQRSPMPARAAWRLHALRSLLLLVCLVSYFHALTVLPLVQAAAISYLAPLLVSVLAVWWLHERPSPWLWAALGLGLAGVLVALGPELLRSVDGATSDRLTGLASAALAALAFAFVMLLARRQAQSDSLWTILLLQNVMPASLLALPASWDWVPLQGTEWQVVALAGLFATIGLVGLTWSFKHLEASRVAPLEYTGIVWAAGLGFVFFGETPTRETLLSAVLIVGGCLLLLRR